MISALFAALSLGFGVAHATPSFDPTTPAERFMGEEVFLQDGSIQLWSAIERLEDADRTLFTQESFNGVTAWADSDYAPWIATCFGTSTPHSSAVLLHMGLREAASEGTPVLFVPGAGDNGSRGFITMATRLDEARRPVYSLTFAHPHGDVFQQAEAIANAIARIKDRTGADQVDVVSHSKGGISTAIYLSHHSGAAWSDDAYVDVGTAYRGDVRRAVFIATPLGGTDTTYRWPLGNAMLLDADTASAPSSWQSYYPAGTATWWNETDLSAQDFLPGGAGDLFPGQRQILARWDDAYPLPGELPWLGTYALQPDWYTTYEGGLGYVSESEGIDAAIEAGGDVLGSLRTQGVDPGVELYLLAGENPLLTNGAEWYLADFFGETFLDAATAGSDAYAELLADAVGDSLVSGGISEAEVQGLAQGKLVLGEITGPSDGVVFVDSATDAGLLTARGAVVVESRTVDLAHLDLLYASPITGEILLETAASDPTEWGFLEALGDRYIEADTLGWVEEVLADDAGTDSGSDLGGDSGEDTGTAGDTAGWGDAGMGGDGDVPHVDGDDKRGGCGFGAAWVMLLPGLLGLRRRDDRDADPTA